MARSSFWDLFQSPLPTSRWMREFFGDRSFGMPALPIDVTEDDGHYVLSARIPGLDPEDLTIECRDGLLTIHGEKRSRCEEETELLERSSATFSRTLALPGDADLDDIDASFRDGVLRIEIPIEASAKPTQVSIER